MLSQYTVCGCYSKLACARKEKGINSTGVYVFMVIFVNLNIRLLIECGRLVLLL